MQGSWRTQAFDEPLVSREGLGGSTKGAEPVCTYIAHVITYMHMDTHVHKDTEHMCPMHAPTYHT